MPLFFALLLCLGVLSSTTSIVVAADERGVPEETSTKIVKNAQWMALEQDVSTPQYQVASRVSPEATAQYLLNKYEGAELFAGGIGQRIQSGSWNVYYNTSNGKQTARTAYNGIYVGWSGTGGMAATWAAATGVGWIAGVIFGAIGGANAYFASLAKTCRDQMDSHGNTGTARMTLTEARWSANYDNRW